MSDYNRDNTIEEGDHVRVVRVDRSWSGYTRRLSDYLERDGVVTKTDSSHNDSRVTFEDGLSLWFKTSWLEIMSPAGSKEPFIDWAAEDDEPDLEAYLEEKEYNNRDDDKNLKEFMSEVDEYENAKQELWDFWKEEATMMDYDPESAYIISTYIARNK